MFQDRYFYNTRFANSQWFDSMYVARLLSEYKHMQPSLTIADVLKCKVGSSNSAVVQTTFKGSDK